MFRLLTRSLLVCALASCAIGQMVPIDSIQYTTNPNGDSPLDGQIVSTWGFVTALAPRGFINRYYIGSRDGGQWSGILVRDNLDPGLSIGDSVSLTATVDEVSNQTVLTTPITNFFRVPAGVIVPALVKLTGAVGEPEEGVLIEVQNAVVTNVNSDTSFVVNDNSGSLLAGRTWITAYYPRAGDTLRYLRGIVVFASNAFSVNPRNDADLGFFGNRPPTISSVQNLPASPTNLEPDTILATIFDDVSVQSAAVFYRFGNAGEFSALPMFDDGLHRDGAANDGLFGTVIPAGPARATCYYYILASDDDSQTATSPADAPTHTYTFLIRSSTLSIYDLQYTGNPTGGSSPYAGQTVTVTGIVTGTNFGTLRTNFFMSDPGGGAWSGIFVFSPSLTPSLGDCVRVTGGIVEFSGITEYSSNVQVTLLGTGQIPSPIDIPIGILADSAEAYEGVLIRVGGCTVNNIDEWQSNFPAFRVRDSLGNQAFVVGEAEFEYEPFVEDEFTYIIGCLDYFGQHGWEISPRFDSDLGYVDRRPPILISATSVGTRLLNINFNERLAATGIDSPLNYTVIDLSESGFPELHVESATLFSSGKTIGLHTLEQLEDSNAYRVTVHQVADAAGNILQEASTSFEGFTPRTFTPIASLHDSFDYYESMVEIVTLRAVVSFVQDVTTSSGSRRISAFIQDESGFGFSLSQSGAAAQFPSIQRGNLIEVTGRVSQFSNTIQLNEFNEGSTRLIAENQPLPEPIEIRTGDYRRQSNIVRTSHTGYFGAGTWVRTTGTIYRVDENVGGGTNIFIDDGSGNLTVRVWDSMNMDSVSLNGRWFRLGQLVGITCSIAGPSSTFEGDFQMLAGYAEDFTTDLPSVLPSESLQLSVINGPDASSPVQNRPFAPDLGQKISIFYNTPALSEVRLRIYDLRGHLVTTLVNKSAGGPNRIEWDGRDELRNLLPIGTYILHLETVNNGETDSKVKPIVVGTKL